MGNNNSFIQQNSIAINVIAFIMIIAGVMYAESFITQLLMALVLFSSNLFRGFRRRKCRRVLPLQLYLY